MLKIKQLFCNHKNLTAIKKYIPISDKNINYTTAGDFEMVDCVCNKCGKKITYELSDLQYLRHNFIKNVDTTKIKNW